MASQLRLRRGSTATHSTFTGALGEVTVDTDKKCLVLHDGATLGGIPLDLCDNPFKRGAKGDGVANDTDALLAAIATGKSVYLGGPENTFLISSSLTLNPGQVLFGSGATIKTTANIAMVVMAARCRVAGVRFQGNSTGSSQRGIFIDGGASYNAVSRTQVDGCQFRDLGGSAYYVTRVVDAHQGNVFSGNVVSGCVIGVDIGERGEYTSIIGNNIDSCSTGIRIIGGNTSVVGGVVSDCAIGVLVGAGGNDAHGLVSGCLINHSTQYCVKVDSINTQEFRFSGCSFYYGDVWLRYSGGVLFDACTFGSTSGFYFEQAIDNYFVGCRFVSGLPTFNHRYLGTQSKTHFVDSICHGLSSGGSAPDINGGFIEVSLSGSSPTLGAGTQIAPFNTVLYNAITNDRNYTYQSFFDNTAGQYKFQNLSLLKSPNKNFYADVEIAISIGAASGSIDYSKLSVYLCEVTTGRVVANLTPSVQEFGSNPGVSWKVYTLTGRVTQSPTGYQVIIENNTGVTITCWREQGATLPFKAKFSNF